jgi:hypothetical protein
MLGRVLALSAGAIAMAASCGPAYPTHDGYPEARRSPWEKPKVLELSSDREAEVDDSVSYVKRRRARWYAIDIPAFGEMDVRVSTSQLGKQDDEFDLAFEILAPDGRVLIRADAEEDDAGDEVKTRSLAEMPPGRYLIHVYVQRRTDQADFSVRIQYRASSEGPESSFPAEVAYVEPLATVPAVDDAPPPPPPRCRGPRCRKRPPPPKDDQPAAKSFRALISLVGTSGSGTDIRIAAGGNRGIDKGWRGRVITKAGGAIPDGSFTVTRVTATEAYATVKASPDAVRGAKYVRLVPP